jgi:hypothetical protein
VTHEVIWIASYPKSGNTWVRIFLANYILDVTNPVNISSTEIPFSCGEDLKNLDHGDGQVYAKTQKHYSVDLHRDYRSVLILRHPCDIVPSFADHKNCSIDEAVGWVSKYWPLHVESWVNQCGIVIKYEDMHQTPEPAFEMLVQYLELPYNLKRLWKAIQHSHFDGLRKQEEAGGFIGKSPHSERFYRKGKMNVGHEKLTLKHIDMLCGSTEFWEMGYEIPG